MRNVLLLLLFSTMMWACDDVAILDAQGWRQGPITTFSQEGSAFQTGQTITAITADNQQVAALVYSTYRGWNVRGLVWSENFNGGVGGLGQPELPLWDTLGSTATWAGFIDIGLHQDKLYILTAGSMGMCYSDYSKHSFGNFQCEYLQTVLSDRYYMSHAEEFVFLQEKPDTYYQDQKLKVWAWDHDKPITTPDVASYGHIWVGDVDGDGSQDLVSVNSTWLNQGGGKWRRILTKDLFPAIDHVRWDFTIHDLNNDGKGDIVGVDYDRVFIMLQGATEVQKLNWVPKRYESSILKFVRVTDLNADGKNDIVLAGEHQLTYFLQN